ncbi:hypothetical protein D3OALGA1CA_3402 [Olavius algarvensis associated proteobacterium Delta 3]|nr:protein of unknown function DUF62 [Olavius algarvensis associated proteobacterium Delta 3]CAB5133806.1 hypothetical protein D3OALGA1CA_3402 [Olavius algarvensis associated proteobacterium Delta 3]
MIHQHDLTDYSVPMPVITLLTDFGLDDEYVGIMKGVILSLCPQARIIDISHHVAPQHVHGGAFMLRSAYRYFPAKTIHIAVVDPGVGSSRSIVAIRTEEHVFMAPDNGLLTWILEETQIEQAVRVDNPHHALTPISRTFHGRDVFAPAAAHLACGSEFASLGSPMDPDHLIRLPLERAGVSEDGSLVGSVIHIDRFGNLVTDIDRHLMDLFVGDRRYPEVEIAVGGTVVHGISNMYADAEPGRPVAVIGSRGFLELAVNQGHAAEKTGSRAGDRIFVRVAK